MLNRDRSHRSARVNLSTAKTFCCCSSKISRWCPLPIVSRSGVDSNPLSWKPHCQVHQHCMNRILCITQQISRIQFSTATCASVRLMCRARILTISSRLQSWLPTHLFSGCSLQGAGLFGRVSSYHIVSTFCGLTSSMLQSPHSCSVSLCKTMGVPGPPELSSGAWRAGLIPAYSLVAMIAMIPFEVLPKKFAFARATLWITLPHCRAAWCGWLAGGVEGSVRGKEKGEGRQGGGQEWRRGQEGVMSETHHRTLFSQNHDLVPSQNQRLDTSTAAQEMIPPCLPRR